VIDNADGALKDVGPVLPAADDKGFRHVMSLSRLDAPPAAKRFNRPGCRNRASGAR
jgi:hypothetical protein